MGSVSSGPVSADLMCAGMSSSPSSVCVHANCSGTAASNHVRKSRRTSGEAFSFSVSDAEVWRSSRWQSPARNSATSGSARSTSPVIR